MGFIRKLAVKSYSKELSMMIDGLSKIDIEQIATILIYSVWLRATLEIERNLPVVEGVNGELDPELHMYPILLEAIQKWMSVLKKNGQETKSFSLSIWVHTLRSILRPELSLEGNRLWDILMSSKSYWEKFLTRIRDEDIQLGIQYEQVINTEKHARAILQCLPPKQLYQKA